MSVTKDLVMNFLYIVHICSCVYCGLGFALETIDAIVTPCLHTYHILCAAHHFSYTTQCIKHSCSESLPNEWMAAMGFGHTMIEATGTCSLKTQVLGM